MAYANGRLYAINSGDSRISVFTVNPSTGALTHLPFSPFKIGGSFWGCVAVHPSGSPVIVGTPLSQLAGSIPGDVNGDARSDLLWRNTVTGQNIGWLMNGLTVDFKADVIWRHKVTGENIQWLMNGLTVATATFLPTIADTNWQIVGSRKMSIADNRR